MKYIIFTLSIIISILFVTNTTNADKYDNQVTLDIRPIPHYPTVKEIQQAREASVSIITFHAGTFNVCGSGVIIYNIANKKLLVLTVVHVVKYIQSLSKDSIVIVGHLFMKEFMIMKVKAIDKIHDLALLEGKIAQEKDGPSVPLSPQIPLIGEHLWMIGSAQAIEMSVSKCVLSSVSNDPRTGIIYITNLHTYEGISGGGLFNQKNQLVGIMKAGIPAIPNTPLPGPGVAIGLPEVIKFLNISKITEIR